MVSKSQPVPAQFVTSGSSAYSHCGKNTQGMEGGEIVENYQVPRVGIAPILQQQHLRLS